MHLLIIFSILNDEIVHFIVVTLVVFIIIIFRDYNLNIAQTVIYWFPICIPPKTLLHIIMLPSPPL